MITAPFNFVPLGDTVFFPDWSDAVSHDIPFKDGESGSIDITITAKSPIFIRNHSDDKNTPSKEFCHHNGDYYIPGSSVKGMIRNVLEIMSFSKMSQLNDNTYTIRDLQNSNLYMSKMQAANIMCGWLKKVGDTFMIEDCGHAGRIKHEEIDKVFGIDFSSKFQKGKFSNKETDKTALKKYEMVDNSKFTYSFKYTETSRTNEKRYCYDEASSLKGTIVFTGQPSGRDENKKPPSGKVYEFIFFQKKQDIKVSQKTMEDFLFAYFDKRKTQPKESPDWSYWKEKLYNGEKVPVFFQKKDKEIAHFGLSYLYKLPYLHSTKDGLFNIHYDSKLDLSQTIFGYASKDKSLKGRVMFSHFKAASNVQNADTVTEILGTPRASYYPIYVKQQEDNLYKTYMDDCIIAGWKRYPIHKGSGVIKTKDSGNKNMGTSFTPLKQGSVFKGKLRYHNLKKTELGALLSALTFHNTENTYHNIGMAKSLGYGKVELKLDGIEDLNSYLKSFELTMTDQVLDWKESSQLKELLTMATEQNNAGDSALKYMELEEFSKNKVGTKYYLKKYTELEFIKETTLNSLLSQSDLDELKVEKERYAQEQKDKALKQQEEERFQDELDNLNYENIHIVENFIKKYSKHEKIDEVRAKQDEIKKSMELDKFSRANENFKSAYDALMKKKSNPKQYKKELDKFVKKWEAHKNNKSSPYILERIEKLKSPI